ncbi:MAG: phosphate regulon transcriptional regulatory protein PhoB [Porticoccaceae bacterium]|jgi:two-component system phosphate regulon response regulator PhoB|nr:phosphate regulon transcriptional regulatory protein PhoB [Porticoccaceae bacterium]|tara:strand:- start:84 stop:782 length:699 start_codon:yes stop_codon:yes gene_type:complete
MAKQSILVIDDEPAIRDMLQIALDAAGFKVGLAEDAKQAYPIIIDTPPDLILLDWMMPGTSGIELLRRLRRDEINVPVIMLTAKVEEASKISGLDSGADDYIAKPFSPRELVSRVKAILRRTSEESMKEVIFAGALKLNQLNRRVNIGDTLVSLGPTEYKLLQFFLTHQDRVYTRDQILDNVWGRNVYLDERTVDVHIRRLRKAISIAGHENYVQTVRGAGYRFSIQLDKST